MISIGDIVPLFAKGYHHPTMLTILQALLILIGEVSIYVYVCVCVCVCVCVYVCVCVCAHCIICTHEYEYVGRPQSLPLWLNPS